MDDREQNFSMTLLWLVALEPDTMILTLLDLKNCARLDSCVIAQTIRFTPSDDDRPVSWSRKFFEAKKIWCEG